MLVYDDPAGNYLDPGTLRFFVADTINENVVMTPGYESVSEVDTLNVTEDTIAIDTGDGQSANVGTAVPIPPSVKVTDSAGTPVAGVPVTFAVASGGGSITGGSTTTNASGIATVGSWTLGASPGANTLTATSPGLTGSPVTFTATATPFKATPTVYTWPTASPINLGRPLSDSTLSGGTASVEGSFAFTYPATVPTSTGTYSALVTFTPTDTENYQNVVGNVDVTVNAGPTVLTVKYQGTTVRTYSLAQLAALTPAFEGYAGTKSSGDTVKGPDAVTGVKITDIVADARGTALNVNQAVTVAQTIGGSYSKTFSYDRLVNFTGFAMYDATSKAEVPISSLTGPLATILVYGSTRPATS